MNTTTKEIHSLDPLPTQSNAGFASRGRAVVVIQTRMNIPLHDFSGNAAKLAGQALHKVSLETIVNVLLWAVELYVLTFFLKQFLG